MAQSQIRVLLVEDSPVALLLLKRILSGAPDIEVVGTASNGLDALELIPRLQPHVICTDLHMPKMSGLEMIQRVMATVPTPILVISASVQQDDSENVFQLLQAGAVDVFPKPMSGLSSEYEQAKADLITKIRVLSGVSVFTQHRTVASFQATRRTDAGSANTSLNSCLSPTVLPQPVMDIRLPKLVAIGASTGGPQALYTILKQLPAHFPVPILCVQHISDGFLQGLVDWLNAESALSVKVAEPGQLPQPGCVYFPAERSHLQIDAHGRLTAFDAPPVAGHCPSVTVLFQSIATHYRQSAVGVLLTGMGRDGADGLKAIADAGGTTVAQDEESCIVYGMPKEAIALGAVQQVLPLSQIAPTLKQIFRLERSHVGC